VTIANSKTTVNEIKHYWKENANFWSSKEIKQKVIT